MLKCLLEKTYIQYILGFIAFLYIRFIFWTSSWTYINFEVLKKRADSKTSTLFAFWHGHVLMAPCLWTHKMPFYMLISAHKDGRLISKTISFFGIKTITGSTNKAGALALRDMLKRLKENSCIGITPDGPRGPRHSISPGTIMLSYLAQTPILPIIYDVQHKKELRSWDKFILPRSFNKGVFVAGNPVHPPKNKDDLSTFLKELSKEFIKIEKIAKEALQQ